jgi:hypothetical protein
VYDEVNERLLLVREDHLLADPKDMVKQVVSLRTDEDESNVSVLCVMSWRRNTKPGNSIAMPTSPTSNG